MSNRILIIDGNNLFIRNYIVKPHLSTNGAPLGGISGTLLSLQKLCREMKPDTIFFCWDGGGGSLRRKQKNKNYKKGRKPVRLNRFINPIENPIEQEKNRIWQMVRTMEYLNYLPLIQIMLDDVEADDVVAYIRYNNRFTDDIKIIVSNDKDFLQLCTKNTLLYRPIKEEFMNEARILNEYKIHPNNFALTRAIAGDKSDNLPGISGAGLKSLAKLFPELSEDELDFSKFFQLTEARQKEKSLKLFNLILDNKKLIKDNYNIMQLYLPSLSPLSKRKIDYSIDNFECEMNKLEIQKMLFHDGMGEINLSDLFIFSKKICK